MRNRTSPKARQLIFLLWLSLTVTAQTIAQDTISATDWLAQELQNIRATMTAGISSSTFRSPFFDKIEFRTETDEFQWNRQRFQVRFSPRSQRVRSIERQLYGLYEQEAQIDLAEEQEEAIIRLHENWLAAYETHQLLNIAQKKQSILSKQAAIIERLVASGQAIPEKWINLQHELFEAESAIQIYQNQLITFDSSQTLEWTTMPEVELLAITAFGMNISTLSTYDNQIEQQLNQREIDLEQAESQRWLDFIGMEYNRSPDDIFREQVVVGAAVLLPFRGDSKLKLAELEIEQQTLMRKAELRTLQTEQQLEQQVRILANHFTNWTAQKDRLAAFETRMQNFMQRLQQSESADPLLSPSFQLQLLDQQLELFKLEMEVRETFLKLMEESGQLFVE